MGEHELTCLVESLRVIIGVMNEIIDILDVADLKDVVRAPFPGLPIDELAAHLPIELHLGDVPIDVQGNVNPVVCVANR